MIFISIHDNNNQLYSRHLQWNTFWEGKYIKMREKIRQFEGETAKPIKNKDF